MTVPRIRRWRSYGNIWRLTSWHRHGGSHRTENDWGMRRISGQRWKRRTVIMSFLRSGRYLGTGPGGRYGERDGKRREILVLGSEFVPFTVDPDAPSVSRSVLKSFRGTEAWSMLHGVRPIFSSAVRAVPCVCAESSWKRRRSTGIPGGRMMNMPGSCPCAWTAVTFCIVLRYGGECTRVMYPNARCGIWTDGSLFPGIAEKS